MVWFILCGFVVCLLFFGGVVCLAVGVLVGLLYVCYRLRLLCLVWGFGLRVVYVRVGDFGVIVDALFIECRCFAIITLLLTIWWWLGLSLIDLRVLGCALCELVGCFDWVCGFACCYLIALLLGLGCFLWV